MGWFKKYVLADLFAAADAVSREMTKKNKKNKSHTKKGSGREAHFGSGGGRDYPHFHLGKLTDPQPSDSAKASAYERRHLYQHSFRKPKISGNVE